MVFHSYARKVLILAAAITQLVGSGQKNDAAGFRFEFTYQVSFPVADKIEAWIPLPSSGPFQMVETTQIQTRPKYVIESDSLYGNLILHIPPFKTLKPETLTVKLQIQRQEARSYSQPLDNRTKSLFVRAYEKVPLNDTFRNIADSLFQLNNKGGKRVYDYILDHMEYDKSGIGWGQGDAQYACDIGKGNCTDYHSFFNALVRSEKIPARFHIGFSIPPGEEGTILGYHCWTEFYDSGTWIPVDISEADKHPRLTEYYFGRLDNRRIGFTVGRDIPLPGGKPGDTVNFLVYPYVKINDRVSGVGTQFLFKTLP